MALCLFKLSECKKQREVTKIGGPLEGIRVLAFTQIAAGPFGTVALSDMGAEVIKIENVPETDLPGTDDPAQIQVTPEIAHFWAYNRGTKGICLDVRKQSAMEVFIDLVNKSDVVYDNFRASVPKKLGIDYDTIKQYNPRIISCSISGYGEGGPWTNHPSYDMIAQALTGVMGVTGEPGRMPIRCGVSFGDIGAGLFSAFGIVCALLDRERTGVGQRIETSIFDVLLAFQTYHVPQTFGLGMKLGPEPRRSGAGQVPYGPFKTKDGSWIGIAAGSARFWVLLCKTMRREELITDPRFNSLSKRQQHENEVAQVIEEALSTKTAKEWEQIFFKAGVPAGKVNTIEEAFQQSQTQARDMLISFDHPLGKKMKCAGNPLKLPTIKDQEYKPAPGLGEHTQEILSELLGYSSDKVAKLKKEGAVWWPDRGISYGGGAESALRRA